MFKLPDYFVASGQFYYIMIDPEGYVASANPLFSRHFLGEETLATRIHISSLLIPSDTVQFLSLLKSSLELPQQLFSIQLIMKRVDGTSVALNWECSAHINDHGMPLIMQAISTASPVPGITEPSGTLNAGSQERYMAFEHSAEGLWMFVSEEPVSVYETPEHILAYWQDHSVLVECNDNMARMYGFEKAEEMKGVHLGKLMDFSEPALVAGLRSFIQNGFATTTVETREYDKDGQVKYFLNRMTGVVEQEYVQRVWGTQQDITPQRLAEEKLRESELFYRNMITHSLDGIVLTDKTGGIRYCSPSIEKISGYETAKLLGRKIFEFVHPADINIALQAFDSEMRKESQMNYLSLRLRHANGEWVWCTARGHNLMENPVFNAMVIYFTNDSKRKAIEDKLRESEHRFRSLVQNVKMGVTMREPSGKLIMANRAAEEMLGLGQDELSISFDNRDDWDTINEDGTPLLLDEHPVPVSLRTGAPVQGMVMGVYRKKYNDRVWILANTEPVTNDEGQLIYVICSFMDITEQKRMAQLLIDQEIQKQKQVTQATIDAQEKERIEIGKELHDNINQHLNTTRLYLEVAKEKANGEVLQMINQAHKNMAGIINEIRQMSQSLVPPTLGDLGLAESIQDLCDNLRRSHKFKIKFTRSHFEEELIPDNLKLSLFRIIQEKITNIIRHSEATQISIKLQTDAEFIFLFITDNGKGFDTRTVREGLGLNNIRTRVALFNGKMELKTAPGEGCVLNVTIPYHRETEAD